MRFIITLACVTLILASCGGDSASDNGDPNGNIATNNECGFSGTITGELNYTVTHDLSNGCGGATTPDGELITSFGGLPGSEPNIKIYHENFMPGQSGGNNTAHIIIHRVLGDNREWATALGACTINISSSQVDSNNGKIKISGNGSCASAALPDTNSGATTNISIEPFSFESMWLTWP